MQQCIGPSIVAAFVLLLDQFTKMLVARRLAEGQSAHVSSWIRIRHVANERRAGLGRKRGALLLACAALVCATTVMVWQGYFLQHGAVHLALGMAFGGACGNIYDQVRRGAVLDFIDLDWWPVFNFADAAITLGALTALLCI